MKKLIIICLIIVIAIMVVSAFILGQQKAIAQSSGSPKQSTIATVENKSVPATQSTCTPITCQQSGRVCGSLSDGCGGTLNCGSCPSYQSCGSDGRCSVPSTTTTGVGSGQCTPNCAGKSCGDDGCGGSCGTCANGMACGSDYTCSSQCALATCSGLGKGCGPWPNGCGGTLNCGSCGTGYACQSGACVYIFEIPMTAQDVGEAWWTSIFVGDWNTLLNYTVDSENNSLTTDCQNRLRSTYASFVGATYSLNINDTTTSCADLMSSPLPTSCVASDYYVNTSTEFGSFTGLLYFVNIGGEWKSQVDCKWYA